MLPLKTAASNTTDPSYGPLGRLSVETDFAPPLRSSVTPFWTTLVNGVVSSTPANSDSPHVTFWLRPAFDQAKVAVPSGGPSRYQTSRRTDPCPRATSRVSACPP